MAWGEANVWKDGEENAAFYQALLDDAATKPARDAKRRKVIKPREMPWELSRQGLIKHLGLSTVNAEQVAEAQSIAPVVCVQNFYNIANRDDDPLVDSLAAQGVAYVPYFPLGGFTPLQSEELQAVAARLEATPLAVALAWLLHRSPNILLIPGTSSIAHLRENVAAAALTLPDDALTELNIID